ncbi:sugar ABC transporter permease (plasmid) [Agrobacterium leguminum]|uniref:carbohydrate ABC transporter permease n=1 Tax=Agrobacterium leguminum TaxID=2792015 RepID=UPI00272D2DF8|nr:sugar ABC transporter permease [Agrobacterium leguminum]WLE00760.1 sugar ABC transporter permease [Agrobacterium leguminum]
MTSLDRTSAPTKKRRSRSKGDSLQQLSMLLPGAVLVLTFMVAPFVYSIWLSMTNERLIPRPVPSKFIGFDNYTRLAADPVFWQALGNLFRFTVLVLPLQCGFALLVAIALNQKLPFRGLFRSVFFLPSITSMVVVCIIWSTIFQFPTGPLNSLVNALSFGLAGPVDWLGDRNVAMFSIVLLSAWASFGFQMIIYLAGLQNISAELYDAARMDGAGPLSRFWNVTMPGLRETHVFVLIVTTIQAFKLFTQVELLTGGGPGGSTETLVRYMVTAGFTQQRVGYGSAVAVVLFLIIMMISMTQRFLTRNKNG